MFESLDALMLARIQFGFTIAFHIIFPAFTIGLASYLAVLEGLYLKTRRQVYMDCYHYWLPVFAISFGMGVVSGVVMSYQFGTNWSVFSDKVGNVLGPLMAYEVLSAFFLEAGFLGIMLFGLKRVGIKLHFFATLMVAIGTLASAFWILSVNSWMHTPAGYEINSAGQFIPVDWWAVVFNPSFPYRLVHMVLAAYLTTAFVVAGVAAYHLLREPKNAPSQLMFSMAMWMALLVAPLQLVAGDLHGLNTLQHQPAKIAAMEGHFQTQAGAPLILLGLPDMDAETTHSLLEIPRLGSLILTHRLDGVVKGLEEWAPEDRPDARVLFFTFRIMVGIGLLMILLGLISLLLRWRQQLYTSTWFLRSAVLTGPLGFVAVLSGWMTTEIGRQPYTVYGLLRTSESVSPIATIGVASSLLAFVVVYLLVFGAGTAIILKQLGNAPGSASEDEPKNTPEDVPTTQAERVLATNDHQR